MYGMVFMVMQVSRVTAIGNLFCTIRQGGVCCNVGSGPLGTIGSLFGTIQF